MKTSDIVIIGGGAIGCCIAYRLAQAGFQVIIVERETPGAGASSSAGGILSPQHEAQKPGPLLDLMLASHGLYPRFAEELFEDSDIDIQYEKIGALELILNETEEREAAKRTSWQQSKKLPVRKLDASALIELEPNLTKMARGAIYFPEEARVGNRTMVKALVVACHKLGVKFITGEEVLDFRSKNGRIQEAITTGERISGETFIIASGAWSSSLGEKLGFRFPIFPVRGQMIQLRSSPPPFTRLIFHNDFYLISKPAGRIIVGSTMEEVGFDKRTTVEGIQFLLNTAVHLAPSLGDTEISKTWACFRPTTPDRLPIIGPIPGYDNLIAATGHFRHGIQLTPITAKLIVEWLTEGQTSISLKPFLAERFF